MRQKQSPDQTLLLSKDFTWTNTWHAIMGYELRIVINVQHPQWEMHVLFVFSNG